MFSEKFYSGLLASWIFAGCVVVSGCAQVSVPDARTLDVPTPKYADERQRAVNERPDSVMYLPLGEDVLVPEAAPSSFLSFDEVGPFEIRSETLAGSLQLILADYDISIAFETEEALSRRITVANLRGPLHTVVNRVCGLADLYCSYEDGILVVKDTQTFTVTLPPIGDDSEDTEFLDNVVEGLGAVLGEDVDEPISDPTTRTIVYNATQRTSDIAARYFQRLRANTALVVFETYIWEVQLNAGNSMGIDWDSIDEFGKFNTSFAINGSIDSDFTNPVSIGLPTTQDIGAAPTDLVQFLSQFGAVKSISQPQITVLSGSSADLRVADTENFVSEISTTIDEGQATTSVSTDSVDSGFELTIGSSWDKSTVYANIELSLTNVIDIANFTFSDSADDTGTDTTIQLPQTSERELNTNIRVRPGDSVLIAGLVTEDDRFNSRGPGAMKPVIPDSRTTNVDNLELVILLRPRVVVYTPEDDYRYQDYINARNSSRLAPVMKSSAFDGADSNTYESSVSASEPVSAPEPDPFLPEPTLQPVQNTSALEPIDAMEITQPKEIFYDTSIESPAPAFESAPMAHPSSVGRFGDGYVSRVSRQDAAIPVPSNGFSPQPVMDNDPMITSSPIEIVPTQPSQLPASDLQLSPYETYDYYVPSY
ncbi:MAG: type II and III secretion system family protein [Pseudomonadota bacterium]